MHILPKRKPKKLSSVMTLKMSEQIIAAAQFNYKLRVRLAGVCDLIAAEAKCHLPCRTRLGRSMGREWTSWAKCNRTCHEWKSLQESYACPQKYSAIIVAAADAFSTRIPPEIVPRSLPRNICSCVLSRKCCSTENIPEVTKSQKDARRIGRTKIRGKCQFQVLVELRGDGIYSPHVHSAQREGIWDLYLRSVCHMLP